MNFILRDGLQKRGITYSNKHLISLERSGLFPRRVRLGGGRFVAWVEAEIDKYQAEIIAKRDAGGRDAEAA